MVRMQERYLGTLRLTLLHFVQFRHQLTIMFSNLLLTRQSLQNILLISYFLLGRAPHRLHNYYYGTSVTRAPL